jgi:hypothetical protein
MDCNNSLVDDCSDCLHGSNRGQSNLYLPNRFGARDSRYRHTSRIDSNTDRTITIVANSHREGAPYYYTNQLTEIIFNIDRTDRTLY